MSDNLYEPEIGQAIFGQPYKEYPVPEIMDAALEFLRQEIKRIMWNLGQGAHDPFGNFGDVFECETFQVHTYSWPEDGQPWNFRYPKLGLEISWYKYLGRGMSSNMIIDPNMASDVLLDCLDACRKIESGSVRYSETRGTF